MVEIDILTLFPQMFTPLDESIIGRARQKGLLEIRLWDIRNYTDDRHRTADDAPFGGGGGMIMKPEPIFRAMDDVMGASDRPVDAVVLLTPQGRRFDQQTAAEFAGKERFVLICGHYEGIDERVAQHYVTDEISIGDFVLTGGELAAMVIIDATSRLIPGVLGQEDGAANDSFATGLLEHPHYTRPRAYRGYEVPEVLLSGDHERIRRWRRREALRRTVQKRPDLLKSAPLTPEDHALLDEIQNEGANQIKRST